MTGYGKSSISFQNKKITVELRSLNSKSLDLNIRMPSIYREKELEMRSMLLEHLERGKVECNIQVEYLGPVSSTSINKELARAYYNELSSLAIDLQTDTTDILSQVLRMPDVISTPKEELIVEEGNALLEVLQNACDSLNEFRKKEGQQLQSDFTQSLKAIVNRLNDVSKYEDERIDIVRERMRAGLEKLSSTPIDENRFEQELIFYIEKMDVSEEKMRLKNHLDYFSETMLVAASGKKLGFISQEIGREINTLGSKSYHVEMQKLVVEMKDFLEKIKEQVLNTL
jgi:uncharacterized protein (TIGR00255 family)